MSLNGSRRRKDLQGLLAKALRGEYQLEAIMASMGEGLSIQDTNFVIIYQNEVQKDMTEETNRRALLHGI